MKTNPHSKDQKQNGSALITVLLIVTVTTLAAGSLYAVSVNMTHRVQLMTDSIRAKTIAEAGANHAYSHLRNNYGDRHTNGEFIKEAFGGGTYVVTANSGDYGTATVVSEGRYRSATARIGLNLRNANVDHAGPPEYLKYAIFSNGDLRFNGTPPHVDGGMHTNADWTLNGSYANVNGKISAQNSASIPDTYRAPWQVIPFPQLSDPDFQAFLAQAEADGILTRYTSSQTFNHNHTFSGVTVIEGDLTLRGSGDRIVDGLLYVTGDITANGSGSMTLDGTMLAGGEVRFNGASGIFNHDIIGDHSQDDSDAEAHVVVSGWWQ